MDNHHSGVCLGPFFTGLIHNSGIFQVVVGNNLPKAFVGVIIATIILLIIHP